MELTIDQALQQGITEHKDGNLKEAERLYRAILKEEPSHPHANHNLGIIAVSLNQTNEALPLFETALQADPKVEQFWLSYTDALLHEKRFADAKTALQKGKEKGLNKNLIDTIEKKLTSNFKADRVNLPSPFPKEQQKLLDHYRNGQYIKAEKLANLLSQDYPSHNFSWKILAAVYKATGRIENAVTAGEKTVELDPYDAEAHNNLAMSLRELGKLEKAEQSLREAASLKPDFVAAHNNLGEILKDQKRLDEAEKSLREAVSLDPEFLLARYNLANVLQGLGKFYDAIEEYEKILAIDPNNGETLLNISNTKLKAVPDWHIPMMNEEGRNNAYRRAMKSAIGKSDRVLDIGTGAGLLSMIAADCGAKKIITCEVSETISRIARKIIDKNGFNDKITVINKNSKDLIVGQDMTEKVDVLVSEILSSEFVGEGIQGSILDAKKRLLKKSGKIIPEAGSIMVALIENTGKLAKELFVDTALGYDVRDFNSISANKYLMTLEDEPVLLSDPVEAFSFDFKNFDEVHTEKKELKIIAKKNGTCAGIVQWLKVDLYDGVEYQNNPVTMYKSNSVSGWKTPIYRFSKPEFIKRGQPITLIANLFEDNLWLNLASGKLRTPSK